MQPAFPNCYGGSWYITPTVLPGQIITLTSQGFEPGYFGWAGYFTTGGTHTLYAYLDSYSAPPVNWGNISESDETNNRAGPVTITVTGANISLNTLPPGKVPGQCAASGHRPSIQSRPNIAQRRSYEQAFSAVGATRGDYSYVSVLAAIDVDAGYYGRFQSGTGKPIGSASYTEWIANGDIKNDGIVNIYDLTLAASNFNQCGRQIGKSFAYSVFNAINLSDAHVDTIEATWQNGQLIIVP